MDEFVSAEGRREEGSEGGKEGGRERKIERGREGGRERKIEGGGGSKERRGRE